MAVVLLLIILPGSLGYLNNLGFDLEAEISTQLKKARQLIWVDVMHLERPSSRPSHKALPSSCMSSEGPCLSLLQSRAPKEIHGLLPPRFLGPGAKVSEEIRQSEFLNAVVTSETFHDNYTLHDSLRTLSQLKQPAKYQHLRTSDRSISNRVWRGSLDLAAWISRGKPLPHNNRYSLGLPNGTTAEWDGQWQTWGHGSVRLAGIAGHIRFSQRILITELLMESCGETPARTVLLVGRQGLNVAWTRLIPLADCMKQGRYDVMSFNATLRSVDELFFAVSGGIGLCLGGFSGSVFAELIEINANPQAGANAVVEAADETEVGRVTDIEHLVLLLYPDRLSGTKNMWSFQPARVSSSALARLVPIASAIDQNLQLKAFGHQEDKCGRIDSDAVRRAMALIRGDRMPTKMHNKLRAPSWNNVTRAEGKILLDEALRCHSGALATLGVPQLCAQSALVRDALLFADWVNSNSSDIKARSQQRALDMLVALLLQEKPPCPDRPWPSSPKVESEGKKQAKRHQPSSHAASAEVEAGPETRTMACIFGYGCSDSSGAIFPWPREALALALGAAFYVLIFCAPRHCARRQSMTQQVPTRTKAQAAWNLNEPKADDSNGPL